MIKRQEWRRVWIYALVLIALTTLPYVLAWAQGGGTFSGFLLGVDDGYSYLGKMRLGARGLWNFYLFYTPEPHAAEPLFFLPYIVPGWLVGRIFAEDNPALTAALTLTYHLMRLVFNLLLIYTLYRFIAAFIRPARLRFLALVLATLGGGLGWLVALFVGSNWLGSLPPELYIPEGFSFLILFGLPHLALARAALLGGLLVIIQNLSSHPIERGIQVRPIIFAGGLWLVVGLAVPFYLGILYVILAVWGLAAWAASRKFPARLALVGGTAALITLPLFAYYALTFGRNSAFAQWSAQNLLPSPHPLHYLLAYMLLIIPALAGVRWAWGRARRGQAAYALLFGWPLVVPLLVYLPLNVQRRMAEAVIVPLAVLAAVGIGALGRYVTDLKPAPRWRRVFFRRALPALAVCSSLFLVFGSLLSALNQRPPVFRPAGEAAALYWLNGQTAPDTVALAAFETGNVLPALTHLRPFVGHGPETLYALDKTAQTEAFFGGTMGESERETLFERFDIRYVIYGPLERALSPRDTGEPAWADDMTLLYDAEGYRIYAP